MAVYYPKSILNNLKIILNIFAFHIILIVCENNTNPSEIKNNYEQINLLLSGQTLELKISDTLIICAYNLEFSNKINFDKNYNFNSTDIKNILCLLIYSNISELYIINNNDNYLKKIQLATINSSSYSNFNLNPYVDTINNNLKCLLTFIPIINYNYILMINNIDLNNIENTKNNQYKIDDHIFNKYHIGCGLSDISNKYITCSFVDNSNSYIYLYNFEIENNNQIKIEKIDKTPIEKQINSNKFLSSFSINKEQNIIFICYKIERIRCFFYNRTDNYDNSLFLINDNDFSLCKNNMKNYFFNETKEYVVICQDYNNSIYVYAMNISNLNNIFSFRKEKNYNSNNISIFYKYKDKEYNLILYYGNYIISNITKYNTNLRFLDFVDFCRFYEGQREEIIPLDSVDIINYIQNNDFNINCVNKITSLDSSFNILIRPTKKEAHNVTDINFVKCEQFLKSNNYTRNDSELFLFLLEIINPNNISLSNKIEYKIFEKFNEEYKEVDFSYCEMFNLSVNYSLKKPVPLNDTDIKLISQYSHWGVNLFDIDGEFYHEFCQVYPDFEYDVIMEDRLKYLYRPYNICEKGCFFEDIDKNFVYCQCPFKRTFNKTLDATLPDITLGKVPTKFSNHFEVFKCFWLVISSNDKINNLGFYLITFMLGGHVPIWCYYISTQTSPIQKYLFKEMEKFGYKSKEKEKKRKRINVKKKNSKKNKKTTKGNTSSEPPKKNGKKKDNKQEGKSNSKKKKKVGTYIQSCYIINNNVNDKNKKDKIIIDKKKMKKGKKKLSLKSKTKKLNNTKCDNSKELIKSSNKSVNPNLVETQNMEDYYYNGEEEEVNYDDFNFLYIPLDRTQKPEPRKESNKILNNYTYEEAIKYDKRSFLRIFFIFLLSKDIIFRAFLLRSPFDSISVLGCAFIFIFACELFFNALFYFDENVTKRFLKRENIFTFTMSTNMPNIWISLIIVYIFVYLIFILTNVSKKLRVIFQNEEGKLKKDKKYIVTEAKKKEILKQIETILKSQNIKNYIFFGSEIILMLLFWYYITAFCHVYSNSQVSWVFNTFFSILFTFIINCMICLIFSILYKTAIGNKSKGLYNGVMLIYNL